MNNQLREAQAFQVFTAIKLGIIILFVTLLGIGFIVQHNTHRRLSEELSLREKALRDLKEKNQIQEAHAARLKNPEMLLRRVQEMGLNLVEIKQAQIVRVYQGLALPLPESQMAKLAQAQ